MVGSSFWTKILLDSDLAAFLRQVRFLSEQKKWWQWDNGDPITYANWLPNAFFSEVLDADERDYAVMTLSDGKWYAVSPDSVIWDMTGMAIIEKADLLDNPSAVEK